MSRRLTRLEMEALEELRMMKAKRQQTPPCFMERYPPLMLQQLLHHGLAMATPTHGLHGFSMTITRGGETALVSAGVLSGGT